MSFSYTECDESKNFRILVTNTYHYNFIMQYVYNVDVLIMFVI